jgi:hypothetical protein
MAASTLTIPVTSSPPTARPPPPPHPFTTMGPKWTLPGSPTLPLLHVRD